MKRPIVILLCLFICTNTIAQSINDIVIDTEFQYIPVSDSEHNFIFHTYFNIGSGETCPPVTDTSFTVSNDTLYVKTYYDIRGAWPQAGCDRIDTVTYYNEIPDGIHYATTTTNVIGYDENDPEQPYTYEDVYQHTFDLANLGITDGQSQLFLVFPNPVKDKLMIENPDLKITSVKLRNASGKLVVNQNVYTKRIKINLKHLPKGVYFVTIEQNGKRLKTERVLKE